MRKSLIIAVILLVVLGGQVVYAGESDEQLQINWIEGPTVVDLGENLAELNLSDKYLFANAEDAIKIMKYWGNITSGNEIGAVASKDPDKNWLVLFEYDPIGYVADDEAGKLDADAILADYKEGTKQDNKRREKQGFPILNTVGWDEKPYYDSQNHSLIWSLLFESEGMMTVNYEVKVLGREGYTSILLIAGPEELAALKPELTEIINNFSYKEGKKYSDFVPGKDKTAEIGLAALIAGTAIKKGLFIKLLLVFKKLWFVVVLGLFGLIKSIYNKLRDPFNDRAYERNYNSSVTNDGAYDQKYNSSDTIDDL